MKGIYVYSVGALFSHMRLPQTVHNFFLWPVATRILGKAYIQKVKMKDQFWMYGSMDDVLTRSVLFLGPWLNYLWEPVTTRLLEELSRDKKRILVAGSHIGYMALIAAKETRGEVVAFEPVKRLHEKSSRNFNLNEIGSKITLVKAALGNVSGMVDMYVEDIRSSIIPYSGGHSPHRTEEVPMTTIDEYAAGAKAAPFDLIFLDIEGYELFALQGAARTLVSKPDLILEVSPRVLKQAGRAPEELFAYLKERGYKISIIQDNYQETAPTGKVPTIKLLPIEEWKDHGYDSLDYFNIYATAD